VSDRRPPPVCRHRQLRFIESGTRLVCTDELAKGKKCGATWVLEKPPGSWMADVGAAPNINVMPPYDIRRSPV
jgi:hypothetical protein